MIEVEYELIPSVNIGVAALEEIRRDGNFRILEPCQTINGGCPRLNVDKLCAGEVDYDPYERSLVCRTHSKVIRVRHESIVKAA